ncbi:MAG: magnesium transporter, partial [Nanoarchaeota archaeon]
KAEVAAHTALRNKIKAIPVVEKGKMLGVIPPNRLLRIMHRSAQEDFMHMAGISKGHLDYENTMKVPIHKAVWHRAPWLLIGLVGIMVAAGFVTIFEEALEEYMILAFFIPAIVYLADALGSQHVTISVRDLASHGKDMNKFKYFLRQTSIAVFLGLIVSLGTFLTITIFWHEAYIGFVIAFALFISAIITNLSSLLTTLGIYKLGRDPAFGSGPFATVISDITSIVVYLLIATMMLF